MKPSMFIEVWSNGETTHNTVPLSIDLLDIALNETKLYENLETIAIWKIYYKNQINEK